MTYAPFLVLDGDNPRQWKPWVDDGGGPTLEQMLHGIDGGPPLQLPSERAKYWPTYAPLLLWDARWDSGEPTDLDGVVGIIVDATGGSAGTRAVTTRFQQVCDLIAQGSKSLLKRVGFRVIVVVGNTPDTIADELLFEIDDYARRSFPLNSEATAVWDRRSLEFQLKFACQTMAVRSQHANRT